MTGAKAFFKTVEFDKGLARLVEMAGPEVGGRAVYDAAAALLKDADAEAPQTPWRSGDLRASRFISRPQIIGDSVSVEVGFNTEYAAYQHEGARRDGSHVIRRWTTDHVPAPGIKFLESKMVANSGKYLQIAVEYLRKWLRNYLGGPK